MPVELTPSVEETTLADFTHAGLITPVLREGDAAGVINELTRLLQQAGCVPDMLPFYHAALNQELLGNSALTCGIALPHARLSGIRQLQFAFGRAPRPIPWGEKWSTPAEFVFLLAVPATDAARYLHLLASLARLGQQSGLLQELRDAKEREGILRVLEKVRLRPGC